MIPAPTISASGPISLPNLPSRRSVVGAPPPEAPRSLFERPVEAPRHDRARWVDGAVPLAGVAPGDDPGRPLTRREARALADAAERVSAPTPPFPTLVGPELKAAGGAPMTRAQARALAHARARQGSGSERAAVRRATASAAPLFAAPPRSRAERRAADRIAARQAATLRTAAKGRRAALTVAVVGLGVALIHDGASTAASGTSGASTNTAALRLGTAAGDAAAAAPLSYQDVFDFYSGNRNGHRHRRTATPTVTPSVEASPTPSVSALTDSASARDGASSSSAPSSSSAAAEGTPTPGSMSASATQARVLAANSGSMVQRMYGEARSGLPWMSGWWVGGNKTSSSMAQAEAWRGSKMDFATAYPEYSSWSAMSNSSWSVSVWKGYGGKLAYGLPLLPQDRRGQWDDVTSGAHDDVFRTIAQQMVDNGFGDSAIRVGLEANGDWFPWGADAAHAAQYKAAFRRVVTVMRSVAPKLTFWFDTSASANPLPGTSGRADMLNALYPGDDVVDGISMDHYDFYSLVAHTDAEFKNAMSPPNGTGLQDAVDFARAHGKGFAVPEWGLHGVQGAGDNPFFIQKMFDFFMANKDVLVFENYFDEPDSYIANSLMSGQDPQSAAMYRKLWAGA